MQPSVSGRPRVGQSQLGRRPRDAVSSRAAVRGRRRCATQIPSAGVVGSLFTIASNSEVLTMLPSLVVAARMFLGALGPQAGDAQPGRPAALRAEAARLRSGYASEFFGALIRATAPERAPASAPVGQERAEDADEPVLDAKKFLRGSGSPRRLIEQADRAARDALGFWLEDRPGPSGLATQPGGMAPSQGAGCRSRRGHRSGRRAKSRPSSPVARLRHPTSYALAPGPVLHHCNRLLGRARAGGLHERRVLPSHLRGPVRGAGVRPVSCPAWARSPDIFPRVGKAGRSAGRPRRPGSLYLSGD